MVRQRNRLSIIEKDAVAFGAVKQFRAEPDTDRIKMREWYRNSLLIINV